MYTHMYDLREEAHRRGRAAPGRPLRVYIHFLVVTVCWSYEENCPPLADPPAPSHRIPHVPRSYVPKEPTVQLSRNGPNRIRDSSETVGAGRVRVAVRARMFNLF